MRASWITSSHCSNCLHNLNMSNETPVPLHYHIVCPILKYGSTIWDPPSASLSSSIESHSVQYFALEMTSKILVCPPMLISFLPSSYMYTYHAAHVVSVITSPFLQDYYNNEFLRSILPPVLLSDTCPGDLLFLFVAPLHSFLPYRTPLQIQLYKCSQSIS